MNFYPKFASGVVLLSGLIATSLSAAPLRVLYFTKSSGFEHSVIKRVDGQPSYSEKILTTLGAQHDMAFTFSKDGSLFTPAYLAQFDVIMFYTSGDLLSAGTDGQPPLTLKGKQALLDAVSGGLGFVALHAASDSFHTFESGGGNPPAAERSHRYETHGDASDPYIKMLGGEFINHNAQQVAKARVVDPAFPGCSGLGGQLELAEEWYSLKEFAPDLHVLLVLDTTGMQGVNYQRPAYPIAWAHPYGQGRVWFDGMGHRDDVWTNPAFQAMLLGGLEWAGGRQAAKVDPNLAKVAPQAQVLPPQH